MPRSPARPVLRAVALLSAGLATGYLAADTAPAVYPPVKVLLETESTVIGQPIVYPAGQPRMTAVLIEMAPGQSTGWHRHDVPLFAWVLEGELTVDYGPDGTRRFDRGAAFVEALGTEHSGTNTGDGPVRLLALFAGADGMRDTIARPGAATSD